MTDKQIIVDGEHDMNYCENNNCKHYGNKEQCEKTHCYYRCYSKLYTAHKRKEQECEELKKANDGILTTIRILAKNNIKLREVLTEIKEIAEKNIRIADLEGLNGVYRRGLAKQILQKISEV